MKRLISHIPIIILLMLCIIFIKAPAWADDSCIFGVSASDVPPNIVFELDSGADMEQIVWHADFDNNTDYTPQVADAWDVIDAAASGAPPPPATGSTTLVLNPYDESYPFAVGAEVEDTDSGATAIVVNKTYVGADLQLEIDTDTISGGTFSSGDHVQRYKNKNNIATGTLTNVIPPSSPGGGGAPTNPNGFFNDLGYGIVGHGGNWYLVKVLNDLILDDYSNGLQATSGNTWTITVEIDLNGNGTIEAGETAVSRTVTLPAAPSTSAVSYTDPTMGSFSIIDNARVFRYSKNYLNWLFFSGDHSGYSLDDPNAGIAVSRFWYAKLAILGAARLTSNKAKFGVYNFTNDDRSSQVQPLKFVVDTVVEGDPKSNVLDSAFVNNINNMNTVTESAPYSPLAEGLATIGGYYNSPSSAVLPEEYCQDQFVIVVSPGVSSTDQSNFSQDLPTSLSDYDGDVSGIGEGNIKVDDTTVPIPINYNGSTWLDDVARYMYTHDMVGYIDGVQIVRTYTVGFLADWENNAFLINTSNNGNGETNLYDTNDPNYGKWHFSSDSPAGLADAVIAAVNDIISATTTFTAPVVPVTRTVSGDRVYLALFKPLEGNFWEGNLIKLGISDEGELIDVAGNAATWPNGALKEDAIPIWSTENWSNELYDETISGCVPGAGTACNYVDNSVRNIYTYLGNADLTVDANQFSLAESGDPIAPDTTPGLITAARLGNPTSGVNTIIQYVRGADALDADGDTDYAENRDVFTGDILHSEPVIVQYDQINPSGTVMVFFGSNDGMLHAVNDSDGTEAWAFIPPDQLSRLKDMVEGTGHQIYVDSSPKAFINDVDGDGIIESGDGDKVILICGERKGGSSYFALDVTAPNSPQFLWWISQMDAAAASALGIPAPDYTIPELGESWSEPRFGKVKTSSTDTTGTDVFFIGGGYSADNSKGKMVLAINVLNGSTVKSFSNADASIIDMNYSIPSSVQVVDGPADANGTVFVDKIYVGDLGSQMWRIGNVSAASFPNVNQDITTWIGDLLFVADSSHTKKFFYPPGVTLESGYDLIFMGTGDREDPCNETTSDSVYAVKDVHNSPMLIPLTPADLVNVTSNDYAANPDPATLDGSGNGWYIDLAAGEKSLADVTIFYKTLYFTTFTPNDDPCTPGGEAKIYAVNYKTGGPVITWPGGSAVARSYVIGGGIPSKPVIIITEKITKLIVSVGSANPDAASESVVAGIPVIDPLFPPRNFFYLWWREIFG